MNKLNGLVNDTTRVACVLLLSKCEGVMHEMHQTLGLPSLTERVMHCTLTSVVRMSLGKCRVFEACSDSSPGK